MSRPVSGIACDNQFICQDLSPELNRDGESEQLQGFEPPRQQRVCRIFPHIAPPVLVASYAFDVKNDEKTPNEMRRAATGAQIASGLYAAVVLISYFICKRGGGPPTYVGPTGIKFFDRREVVSNKLDLRVPLAVSALLVGAATIIVSRFAGPAAGRAVLQGAGVLGTTETEWVPAGSYPKGAL